MRSTFFSLRIRASGQGHPAPRDPAGHVLIEPLEHRQLLTVASPMHDLTAPLHASARSASKQSNDNNSSALPNMLGIYKGKITVKRAVGVSPGSKLSATLRINQETVGGQLAGRLNITNVVTADVTGTITGQDVNLSFVNGNDSGTLTGTVTQDGTTFTGKIFTQVNGTTVRGNFSFVKRRNFPFVLTNTITGTTVVNNNNATNNNLSPAFLASQANGFISPSAATSGNPNFSTGAGIGTGINFSGGTPFVPQPTPIITPVAVVTPTTADLLAASTTSAGSTLQNPLSAGSVLNTPIGTPTTTALATPTVTSDLFSTTPIGTTTVF